MSRTDENLKIAFADESQTYIEYLAYTQKAIDSGQRTTVNDPIPHGHASPPFVYVPDALQQRILSLPKGKRRKFSLHDNSGIEREIRLKFVIYDPVPKVEIDGQLIVLAQPPTGKWEASR